MNSGNLGAARLLNIKLNVDWDWQCYVNKLWADTIIPFGKKIKIEALLLSINWEKEWKENDFFYSTFNKGICIMQVLKGRAIWKVSEFHRVFQFKGAFFLTRSLFRISNEKHLF